MKLKNELTRQSPAILAALGCVGFITSVIMAVKATPTATNTLRNLDEPTRLEKAKAIAPIYAPTVGMMMLSTASIVGSNRIHSYRYASLLALYSIGERSLKRWQEAVLDEVGEKNYEKVRERILTSDDTVPSDMLIDDERVLFYDVYSGRYFRADSVELVRRAINDMNDMLYSEDFVGLNEFYWSVGLPDVEFGNEFGWRISDGSIKIALDAYLKNDVPCIHVSFVVKPKEY